MESIRESVPKIKSWLTTYWSNERDITLILIIVLVGTLGFGLGRLSKLDAGREPIRIAVPATPAGVHVSAVVRGGEPGLPLVSPGASAGPTLLPKTEGQLVGSKNSTKYHLPWCAGAKAIKEENRIWFASAEEAKAAGYTPAANCPGL